MTGQYAAECGVKVMQISRSERKTVNDGYGKTLKKLKRSLSQIQICVTGTKQFGNAYWRSCGTTKGAAFTIFYFV